MRGFRARLVVTFVAVVAATAVVLGTGSYLFVAGSLRQRLVEEALGQTRFNVGVLAARALPPSAGRADFDASGLEEAFRLRGAEVFVSFPEGDPYASRFALRNALELVSPGLRELTASGRLAYEWVQVEEAPYVVAAARLPPEGPDFYFFFPASGVEGALDRMAEALVAGGLLLVLAAALTGGLVAGRVLTPVRAAGLAAGQAAAGDLSVRIPVRSRDEFGTWAESFNRMAASLEEKITELEEAYAAQRRFVADVSHELRTPLTALTTEASLLEGRLAQLGPEDRRLGELLLADVRRLNLLVEDLMEISRLDAAAEHPETTVVDLRPFLEAVADGRHPDASVDAPEARLETDRRRLERIIGNLLDNARRHAPGSPAQVRAALEGGELVLSVEDRGPGVPADRLEHIFERFAKADPSRRGEGSGLGLAIARQHARLLGGDLTARPRPGGGLVFELRIPVTGSLPPREAPVTSGTDHGGDHPGKDST